MDSVCKEIVEQMLTPVVMKDSIYLYPKIDNIKLTQEQVEELQKEGVFSGMLNSKENRAKNDL